MILQNAEDIGALIKERRIALKMDQEALAEKAGTSRKWVVEIEKGKAGAAIGLVLRTLRVLGVTLHTRNPDSHTGSPAKRSGVNLNDVIDSFKKRS
jgi:HTH-type transcriptional regulator / antitoxin HipB